MNLRCSAFCLGLSLLAIVPASAFPSTGYLYTTPSGNPYVENSGETDVTVNDSSGSIATAQAALNNAYSANPGAIITLNLSGNYAVSASPLVLSSNTCLVLQAGTVIQAASGASAASLIKVSGQSNVSIAGGSLVGNGAALNAIQVTACNHVEIDSVSASGFGSDGISITGNGNTSFDNVLTVTRCSVSGCSGNGISVTNGTQCIVIDNTVTNNTGSGIYVGTARSTAANNTASGNGAGITAGGSYNKIGDNTLNGNSTGIVLASGASHTMVASNTISNNTSVGLSDAGSNDVIFQNAFSGNAANLTASGSGANVVAWKGALSASGANYFYPPLIDNQHSLATIVNGMGRTDLTIGSDTLDDVQSQYNSAVGSNPGNVIVLHLTGTYSVGANALNLGSNTVVLLSGTIQESSSSTCASAITVTSGSQNVAISGGTVDGGGRTATNGINLSGGNCVWVHATTVQNFGVPSTRTGNSNGLIKFSSMKGPAFVSSCTTNESGERGIWTEGFGPYVVTDNICTNNNMDGIDCDYTTQEALVKFNQSNSNTRHGIFIEQGATYQVVYGNTFNNNASKAIALFNNAEPASLPVAYNTCFCNVTQTNPAGMSNGSGGTGSDGTTPVTSNNVYFNNQAISDTDGIDGSASGSANYYSQTLLSGNTTAIVTSGAESFFNPATPPAVTGSPTFSPGGGTYTSAQSVSMGSSTMGATIRYTIDGSTPSETNGTVYSAPVSIGVNTTLQAIAYKSGLADSAVTSASYSIQAVAPSFSPGAGSYSSVQSVAISSTSTGVSIRYTTDGSAPTETNGTLYSSPVVVGVSETLRAIAYGGGLSDSSVSSAAYTLTLPQAAAPSFSPGAGSYASTQSVTISSATTGATIRYTTDGSLPSETNGTVYSTPVSVSVSETLQAIAYKSGFADSSVSNATYTITSGQVATPTFSPVGGAYPTVQSVALSTTTSGASIRYTTDGSVPSETAGTVYSGPVSVGGAVALRAIAYETGYADSAVASATYTAGATTFEAENQTIAATSGDTYTINSEAGYSNGKAIQYNAAGAGDYITLRLTNVAAGTYDVVVGYKAYTTRGIVQVSAGTAGGTLANVGSAIDQYGSSSYTSANLGNWTASTSGSQDFKFAVTGHNASSTGYTITLDFIKLTPQQTQTTYTINASAGTGGTISPSGAVIVNQGANQAFSISANSGYQVSTVTVDGSSVGAITSYTFSNVQAAHTISATFSAVSNSNIAPSGTAYGWNANTSSTANTNRTAIAGLNDGNLTVDNDIDPSGDAVNAWEAAGVIWSTTKTVSSADFINGTVTSGGDGFLTANLTAQYTTDGTTWVNAGWSISPAYPYSSSASAQTYTASGSALTGVRGMRFVGQVRSTDTSYHWIVKEVRVYGH